jgi:hypothetical protein
VGVNSKVRNIRLRCSSFISEVNNKPSVDTLESLNFSSSASILNTKDLLKDYLFMYNRDKSILYFYAKKNYFIDDLNINEFLLEKHISNGTYYLGKYSLLSEYYPKARYKEMAIYDVFEMLENDRLKFLRKFK